MHVLGEIGQGLWNAVQMFWEVWWALVLGFALSGVVEAWIPRSRMERALGGRGPRELALSTVLGAFGPFLLLCRSSLESLDA